MKTSFQDKEDIVDEVNRTQGALNLYLDVLLERRVISTGERDRIDELVADYGEAQYTFGWDNAMRAEADHA